MRVSYGDLKRMLEEAVDSGELEAMLPQTLPDEARRIIVANICRCGITGITADAVCGVLANALMRQQPIRSFDGELREFRDDDGRGFFGVIAVALLLVILAGVMFVLIRFGI